MASDLYLADPMALDRTEKGVGHLFLFFCAFVARPQTENPFLLVEYAPLGMHKTCKVDMVLIPIIFALLFCEIAFVRQLPPLP